MKYLIKWGGGAVIATIYVLCTRADVPESEPGCRLFLYVVGVVFVAFWMLAVESVWEEL